MVHDAVGTVEALSRDNVLVIESLIEEPTGFIAELNVTFGRQFAELSVAGHG
jgi:hypothetical protein